MVAEENRQPDHTFEAWAETLLSDPFEAISDILEGREARGALQLAHSSDFMADLLAQPLHTRRRALVEALDRGLLEWMEERICWPPHRVAGFGTRAYVAQFSDALAAVARLPLSLSPMRLIDNVATWDDRFRSMRWPDDIDLLRQFDLALAQHQRDERLASRWFASCEEAAWAGPYWQDSLGTALLGLRKIPDPTNTQPERLIATALARFAAMSSQRKTDSPELRAEFQRQASVLAVLYPRHHSHWKETWANALASLRGFRHHRLVAQDEWLRPALPSQCFPDVDRNSNVPARTNWPQASRRPAILPPKSELDAVVPAIDAVEIPDHSLWARAHNLLERHWTYADYTHHSYYAVRTTHNLCDRLLRKCPSDSQISEIHNWTRKALRAERGNAYIWDLWAKVLAATGAHETSLDIRWEAVRRFPDDLVTRTALIVALAGNGRRELAEHLYVETERDFPNEAVEPRLLREQQWDEAADEMAMRRPNNPLVRELQRVIADQRFFRTVEGRSPLTWPQSESQTNAFLESLSARAPLLQRYFAPPGESATFRKSPISPTSELELVVACRTGSSSQADDLLDSWLDARPASYSVRLLALSKAINGSGPDREEFSQMQSAFPQHRHWNKWLGYAFAASDERPRLRQEARDRQFWGGRLSAVYPGLDVPYRRSLGPESEPLRRLFEDVALANADGGLPHL